MSRELIILAVVLVDACILLYAFALMKAASHADNKREGE